MIVAMSKVANRIVNVCGSSVWLYFTRYNHLAKSNDALFDVDQSIEGLWFRCVDHVHIALWERNRNIVFLEFFPYSKINI